MMADEIVRTACPFCNGSLRAAFKEHIDYDVDGISADHVELVDENSGDCYSTELIHICCNACDKYWYSTSEFHEDAREQEAAG